MIPISAKIILIAGLGFGDEGKGTITDYLVREYGAATVIRYNGGSQAAHNVVAPDGRHHIFSQFGSGTLVPNVRTYLSSFTVIDPLAIMLEAEALAQIGVTDALKRLAIGEGCPVVTPFHKHLNRMFELARGDRRHGSCGKGIGLAVADCRLGHRYALYAGDLKKGSAVNYKLDFLWRQKLDQAEQLLVELPRHQGLRDCWERLNRPDYVSRLTEVYDQFVRKSGVKIVADAHPAVNAVGGGNLIFEGAQGALLDPDHGFWPHVTQSKTTFANAEELLEDLPGAVKKIGVLRAYATRHGAGPFVSEDRWLTEKLPDYHNAFNQWQGAFRVGWLDLVATKYALEIVGGVDELAITNLDRLYGLGGLRTVTAYSYDGPDDEELDKFFEWERAGGQIVIRRIKAPPIHMRQRQAKLTELLDHCQPLFHEFPLMLRPAQDKPLQTEARHYLEFLETALNTPISIVSVGPTAADKIKLKPCV